MKSVSGMAMLMAIGVVAASAFAADQGAQQEHTERTVRFKQIDKNGDGKLSLLEFQTRPSNAEAISGATPAKPDAKTMTDRAARFKQGDRNVDGFLTFEEFKSLEDMPVAGAAGNAGQGR